MLKKDFNEFLEKRFTRETYDYPMRREKYEELILKINKLRTLELNKLEKENKFLSTEVYEAKLSNGKVITRERLLKNKESGDAVIIMPYINENEVLVNIEPKVFTEYGIGIGFAAGMIEKGETPHDAALRELLEETGYAPKNKSDLISLGSFYQDTGASSAKMYSFIARNLKKVSGQKLDESEYVENMTLNEMELLVLEEKGLLADANSIVTLKKATIHKYMTDMSRNR